MAETLWGNSDVTSVFPETVTSGVRRHAKTRVSAGVLQRPTRHVTCLDACSSDLSPSEDYIAAVPRLRLFTGPIPKPLVRHVPVCQFLLVLPTDRVDALHVHRQADS